jgi:hypothetical protein
VIKKSFYQLKSQLVAGGDRSGGVGVFFVAKNTGPTVVADASSFLAVTVLAADTITQVGAFPAVALAGLTFTISVRA